MHFRSGTVGRLLDEIEYRLDPVEGIAEGGRLIVKGPNIMLVTCGRPAGHHRGAARRLVRTRAISPRSTMMGLSPSLAAPSASPRSPGEMVPLNSIEAKIHAALPDHSHAVVAVPDKKKGEQLVLITTDHALDRSRLAEKLKERAFPS